MTTLFIKKSIPGYDIFIGSIKDGISYHVIRNGNLNGYSIQNCTRVGFVYDNSFIPTIPFGNGILSSNGYTFQYFTKGLFDLLSQAPLLTNVDLIACDMNNPKFINEVTKMKSLLPNVSINYSLNRTGGIVGSDWITESNGVSLKNIYFNSNINNYAYSLGGSFNMHSAFIANDGTVWTFGFNFYGQLGNGTTTDSSIPVSTGITNAIFVSCGFFHTLVLKSDGTVWSFGNNISGQLGLGSNSLSVPTPMQIPNINDAIYVSAGAFFSAIVRRNGKVYTFGDNQYGQLGIGTLIGSNVPVEMLGVTNAVMVSCGGVTILVLKSNGTVVGSGFNAATGQLGDGTNTNASTAVSAMGITDAIFVASGILHTAVLRNNKTLLTFGNNSYGQLGTGNYVDSNVPVPVPNLTNVLSLACAGYTTLVVKTDGTVFTFGDDSSGQLGDGTTNNSPSPVQVPGITDAVSISGGGGDVNANIGGYTIILKADGTAISIGTNTYGQLGNGTTTDQTTLPFVNVVLNEGQTIYRLFDALSGTILCVCEGSIVRTLRGRIPIEEVVAGDVVCRENGQRVDVLYNIKMLNKTNKFIKINKNALAINSPSQDLFIIKNHPILFKGSEWLPEQLLKYSPNVSEVVTDKLHYVYCLCTKDKVFVNINDTYVSTRSEKSWNEITEKNPLLWSKQ